MATAGGPDIERNGLVFGMDTGYGVADNSTATRFYPGEPTTNLLPSGPATGTGDFTRQAAHNEGFTYSKVTNYRGRANVHKLYINPSGNTADPYADFGGQYYKSGGSSVGDVYSISFDFYVKKGTNKPGLSTTYANGYKSPSSSGAASLSTNTDVDLADGWTRRTKIATITIAGNTHFRFGCNTGGNETEVYIDNVQIELKSHATPFVDGTRSDTASLIDLKRTTNIDVSNVSFDSTGQPDFDGTDDRIGLGDNFDLNDYFSDGGDFSIAVITKMKESASQNGGVLCNQKYQSESDPAGFGLVIRSANQYALNLTNNTPTSYQSLASIPFNQDEYHHIVYTFESSTGKVVSYSNGTQYTSITNSSYSWNIPTDSTRTYIGYNTQGGWGNYINMDIPIAKVYNRSLSADEVQQNYNAYKNRFNL